EPVRFSRPFLRFDVGKPAPAEQKRLWEKTLGSSDISFNGEVDVLSQQFRLSAKTIYSTGSLARNDWDSTARSGPDSRSATDSAQADCLWDICRSLARPKLEDLAQRVVPCAAWEDLVLPELQIETLRQLASQVRHRLKVHETWGFSTKGRRG